MKRTEYDTCRYVVSLRPSGTTVIETIDVVALDRGRTAAVRHRDCCRVTTTILTPDSVSLPRSVNYIVDYICEPICARWVPCYTSTRQRHSADERPLTVYWARTHVLRLDPVQTQTLDFLWLIFAVSQGVLYLVRARRFF
jgi:hypothetical protein